MKAKIDLRWIATVSTTVPQLVIGKNVSLATLDALMDSDGIILWSYKGLWGLIDKEKVRELQRQYTDLLAAKAAYPRLKYTPIIIHHTDTIEVPLSIARNLWS